MGDMSDYYKEGEMVHGHGVRLPRPAPRFFLAHRKDASDEDLDQLTSACSSILDRLAGGKAFDLVLGRTYFEERFKACGSWNAWVTEVATGVDYLTRAPLFKAIFVPAGPIGNGTAAIVRQAVGAGRRVFTFDLEGRSGVVTGVRTVDGRDWQNGHRLICAKPLA